MKALSSILFLLTGLSGYMCSAALGKGELGSLPAAWQSGPFVSLMFGASIAIGAAGVLTGFLPRAGRPFAFSAASVLVLLLTVATLAGLGVLLNPRRSGDLEWSAFVGLIVLPLALATTSLAAAAVSSLEKAAERPPGSSVGERRPVPATAPQVGPRVGA